MKCPYCGYDFNEEYEDRIVCEGCKKVIDKKDIDKILDLKELIEEDFDEDGYIK